MKAAWAQQEWAKSHTSSIETKRVRPICARPKAENKSKAQKVLICDHTPMSIEGYDHVQLAMPAGGEAEATAFYEGCLGLTRVPKPANLAKRGGCWFESDRIKLHLGVDPAFQPARKAHPALLVRDLDGLLGMLRTNGVPFRNDEPLEGYQRAYVDDPFGNRIELMQPDTP